MIFLGTDVDIVPAALVVDIVNITTNNTVLPMPYSSVSISMYILLRKINVQFDVTELYC